jgi:hypothetical protein
MLKGPLAKSGYDWWWHNFTGYERGTGEAKSFFIEYFVCNPALGGAEPVLGQLEANKAAGCKPSYALVKVGFWGKEARQIHNFYGIDDFSYDQKSLDIRIGDCVLSETAMRGSCSLSREESARHPEYLCDWGSMSWDLSIDKRIAFNVGYGASPFFRRINAFEMFWHAEGIKTEFSGEVILDGRVYDVLPERSYGYADKNWGADFTSPWLWIGSSNLASLVTGKPLANSAVEIGGGNPKVYGLSLGRKLLGCLCYEGEMHEFNFSKFWSGSRISFEFSEGAETNEWKVLASNRKVKMELSLECPKSEMLLINYEAPNGKKLHDRLWNGGTGFGEIKLYRRRRGRWESIDRISVRNAGCEYGEYGAGR